jgi:hypothetical protein
LLATHLLSMSPCLLHVVGRLGGVCRDLVRECMEAIIVVAIVAMVARLTLT